MRLRLRWWLVSSLAVALYGLMVAVLLILIAHNILIALCIVFTILLIGYALWLAIIGRGKRQVFGWVLLIASSAAISIEFAIFLSDAGNRRTTALLAILSSVYIALALVLRRAYWHEKRRRQIVAGATAQFHNPFLIVNPKSGNGRAIRTNVPQLAAKQGITVLVMQADDDVATLARNAIAQGADVLGISGGDGSIGAVAQEALKHDVPMVVLPGGTRCHFARDIGLEPRHIIDALLGYNGVERHVDVASINGRIFLNNASFGLYADIVDHPQYRFHKAKISRQTLQAIASGEKQRYPLRFQHGRKHYTAAVQVLVGVNRYSFDDVLEFGQRERMDEGVLQVTVLPALDDALVRQLLRPMQRVGIRRAGPIAGVEQWVSKTFHVWNAHTALVVGVDGERETYQCPIHIRVLPGALRLYVPPEGWRTRAKNPLRPRAVTHAWRVLQHP
ncbi:MAG TPA: diacylglycerol kinase family protein [Candidatus Saccharimonadales bacterium]|nr:diacylglycerol kinase family protein [Candidatus Saccharimonadales bacterium]